MHKFHNVISAFPGVGKTKAVETVPNLIDLDLPGIPMGEYIDKINDHLGNGLIVLVPSWETLRQAMRDAGIVYSIVYPQRDLKGDYMLRYIKRGSDDKFLTTLNNRWDAFIDTCESDPSDDHLVLKQSQAFLSDFFE